MTELPMYNETAAISIGMILTGEEKAASECREILHRLEEDIPGFRVVHPQNTADELNITMPCYSWLDHMSVEMSEDELAQISAGEVIGLISISSICGAIGVGLGFGISGGCVLMAGGGAVSAGMVAGSLATAVGAATLIGIAAVGISVTAGMAVGTGIAIHDMMSRDGASASPVNVGLVG